MQVQMAEITGFIYEYRGNNKSINTMYALFEITAFAFTVANCKMYAILHFATYQV